MLPDGLLHRLAYDVGGGSGLGQRGQVDDPFDGFVVLAAGAQQVEERGEEDHLQRGRDASLGQLLQREERVKQLPHKSLEHN